MKRSPIRRKSPATLKRECDTLCREVIFARDNRRCIRCGGGANIQWAHVRSRRYLSTRWALENGMTLCASCHFYWHREPLEMALWFSAEYPERANLLKLAVQIPRDGKPERPNLGSVRESLKRELDKLRSATWKL